MTVTVASAPLEVVMVPPLPMVVRLATAPEETNIFPPSETKHVSMVPSIVAEAPDSTHMLPANPFEYT